MPRLWLPAEESQLRPAVLALGGGQVHHGQPASLQCHVQYPRPNAHVASASVRVDCQGVEHQLRTHGARAALYGPEYGCRDALNVLCSGYRDGCRIYLQLDAAEGQAVGYAVLGVAVGLLGPGGWGVLGIG